MKTAKQILDEVCACPEDSYGWSEWNELLRISGLKITAANGAIAKQMVTASEIKEFVLKKCQYEVAAGNGELHDENGEPIDELIEVVDPDSLGDIVMETLAEIQRKPISVTEWRQQYQRIITSPPEDSEIVTEDGSPIRIDMEFTPGRKPFLYTRIYVPNIVCGPLGWFGQRERDTYIAGLKVILVEKSRDEALRQFDLTRSYGLVARVKTLRMALNGNSMLAMVSEW